MISLITSRDRKTLKRHALNLLSKKDIEGLYILVDVLKEKNFKIKSKQIYISMLHDSIRKGHLEIVKCLVDLDGNKDSPSLNHLFYSACIEDKLDIAEYFYTFGCINQRTLNNCFLQASSRIARRPIEATATIKYLTPKGVDLSFHNNYALRMAAREGNIELVDHYLSLGVDLHSQEDQALFQAAYTNKLEMVKHILKLGEDKFKNNLPSLELCVCRNFQTHQ